MTKFPVLLVSIVRWPALVAMLALTFGPAFGQDSASKTYRCSTKDAVVVQDDGTLNKNDQGARDAREHFDRMVITVPSGHVTYPDSAVRENRVVQRTDVGNDYVLISSAYFQRKKAAANATTDFIRLVPVKGKPQALLIAFQLSYLVTGTCDIVQ